MGQYKGIIVKKYERRTFGDNNIVAQDFDLDCSFKNEYGQQKNNIIKFTAFGDKADHINSLPANQIIEADFILKGNYYQGKADPTKTFYNLSVTLGQYSLAGIGTTLDKAPINNATKVTFKDNTPKVEVVTPAQKATQNPFDKRVSMTTVTEDDDDLPF